MKAEKIIVSTAEIEHEIEKVTLLSAEEYKAYKELIPAVHRWWWLRSPGRGIDLAANVRSEETTDFRGDLVVHGICAVRPVLKIRNLLAANLEILDRFTLAKHTWTVISEDLAICDDTVGKTCFRKDWRAEDANIYKMSDIKTWLAGWTQENGISEQYYPDTVIYALTEREKEL